MWFLALLALSAAPARDGMYEISAFGADLSVRVEVRDDVWRFYRVMHPRFEGEERKLEHLFVARQNGNVLKGTLYVRSGGMTKFDELRPVEGSVDGENIVLDRNRLIRKDAEPADFPAMPTDAEIVTAEATALMQEGSTAYRRSKYKEALDLYEKALTAGAVPSPEELRNMAVSFLRQNDLPQARGLLRDALRLDPENRDVGTWYKKARKQTSELNLKATRKGAVQAPVKAVAEERAPATLRFARVPSTTTANDKWQALVDALHTNLGAPVTAQSQTSYAAFVDTLKGGQVDVANVSPVMAAEVQDLYEPLVSIEREDGGGSYGILFALRQNPVTRVDDLRGKTLALVAPHSTSGGALQNAMLAQHKLVAGQDVKVLWLGGHDAVAAAVKEGKADAGGCFEDCRDLKWPDVRQKLSETRLLAYTPRGLADAIVVRRALPADLKRKIKNVLVKLGGSAALLETISQGEPRITAFREVSEQYLGEANALRAASAP
jgi:phosphonate transport system substrate-binding protein